MTRAYVYTMLPSLMTSFKISTMGETIGTMQQDRATAIAGTLGKGPALVPMTITLKSTRDGDGTATRARSSSSSSTTSCSRRSSPTSRCSTRSAPTSGSSAPRPSRSRAARRIKGHGDLDARGRLHRRQPDARRVDRGRRAADDAAGNDLEPVTVEGARRHGRRDRDAAHAPRIERVWLDDIRPRAGPHGAAQGPDAQLPRRGEDLDACRSRFRPTRPGELSVLVTDGRQLNAIEQRELRGVAAAAERRPADARAQRHAPQQPHLRPAADRHARRRRQRRGDDGAAAVGARRCSKATATAAASRRSAAPRSASGSSPMDSAVTGSRLLTIDLEAPVAAHDARASSPTPAGVPCVAPSSAVARASSLVAATPTFWTVSTQADFLKGDVEDLSIDSDGRVFLGPSTSLLAETAAPFLWTVVAGADGTLWAGTGNEGKVLQDRPRRQGRRRSSTPPSSRCTRSRRRRAAASTSPRRPTARSIRSPPTARRRRSSIPTTSTSGRSRSMRAGNVFAATGDKGVIYKITPDGKGTRFYKTSATNVVSLAFDEDRRADRRHRVAGPRLPHRRGRQGVRAARFALQRDPRAAARRRRHDLRRGGERHAGGRATDRAADRRPRTPSRPAVPTVSTEITGMTVVEGPISSSSTPRPRGALGRAAPAAARSIASGPTASGTRSGRRATTRRTTCSSSRRRQPARRAPAPRARSSGSRGDPARATLLARAAARQVTALLREPSGRIVGATSNPGKVFALSSTPARTRHLRVRRARRRHGRDLGRHPLAGHRPRRAGADRHAHRQHRDAGRDLERVVERLHERRRRADRQPERALPAVARGADERQRAGAGPDLGHRGLPAAQPAAGGHVDHRASAGHGVPAAVLDRRAEIAGFEDNTSDGRPPNQTQPPRPAPPAPPAPSLGRRIYQKGLQTFVWKADDDNDDRLQYDVFYRREGETAWKVLKRGLWDPIVVWDTTSVPDGTYVVKVAASDAPSNSPATALRRRARERDASTSTTRRRASSCSRRRAPARARPSTFVVRDEQSAVQRVEYSLDASRWRMVYPKDGIPDSRREEFEVVAGRERGGPQRDHPRDRRDEQRRDGGGARSKLRSVS